MTAPLADTGFAAHLRSRTATAHERTERTRFVDALLRGDITIGGYAAYLAQLYEIYSALESDGAAVAGDAIAAAFIDAALDRAAPLADDLLYLAGPEWQVLHAPLPATQAYCARIREVAATWPGGYVAHHYTRYLGDLSGGQIIAASLRRHYGLGTDGTRFFAFDGIASAKRYKDGYRNALDLAGWEDAERARIVDEAIRAFEHNAAVLHALDGWVGAVDGGGA